MPEPTEMTWPCSECLNSDICLYESSQKKGGTNQFCPVLREYVDQDSIENHEVTFCDLEIQEDLIQEDRNYLNSINDSDDAIKEEHSFMHDMIMGMASKKLKDRKTKAIVALSFFKFSIAEISQLIGLSQMSVYEHIKRRRS